jgi:hypothetical protein
MIISRDSKQLEKVTLGHDNKYRPIPELLQYPAARDGGRASF